MANQNTAPAQQGAKQVTFKDILREIELEAKLDGITWTMPYKIVWSTGPWSPTQPHTDIRLEEPFALNPGYLVFAMFDAGDSYKIYVIQGAGRSDKPLPPACYTLRKGSIDHSAESMSLAMFKEAIGDDIWSKLDEERPGTYDEVECPACGTEVPELPHCGACGVRLPDEDGETREAPTNAATPSAKATTGVLPSAVVTVPAPPSAPGPTNGVGT